MVWLRALAGILKAGLAAVPVVVIDGQIIYVKEPS